jgi:hypothetical protein
MTGTIAAIAVLALCLPAGVATAAPLEADAPEGCEAMNPVAPRCSFTVVESMEGPVAGAAGHGTWIVKVKRGKKVTTIKSPPSGEPTAIEFLYQAGDKVTALAVSPGSGVIAGGD